MRIYIILACIVFVACVFVYYKYHMETFNENNPKCSFVAKGTTLEKCLKICNDKSETNHCKKEECSSKCMDCNTTNCDWVVKKLVPRKTIIEVKPAIESVTISWSAPYSKYYIQKYTLVIQQQNNPNTKELHFPKSLRSSLNTYTIRNLDPSKTYQVFLVSSNVMGNSQPSNIVSFKTLKPTVIKDDISYRQAYPVKPFDNDEYDTILNILTTKRENENNKKLFKLKAHISA